MDTHPAKNGDKFIFVPVFPLCNHVEFAAYCQAVEAFFDKKLGHGEVCVVGRVRGYYRKAGFVYVLIGVGMDYVYAFHAVKGGIAPGIPDSDFIDIAHEYIARWDELSGYYANYTIAATQVKDFVGGKGYAIKHGQCALVYLVGGEALGVGFEV